MSDRPSSPADFISDLDEALRSVQALQIDLGYQQAQAALQTLIQNLRLTEREQEDFGDELHRLVALQSRLEQDRVQIVVFGMVGRGKSSLLNALLGQPVFETGAIHGITQSAQASTWRISREAIAHSPQDNSSQDGGIQDNGIQEICRVSVPSGQGQAYIEVVDTPGIDEVGGEAREHLARQLAQQADLILFVVAGDLTQVEYRALSVLRDASKPMLLVFNKIDQYPPSDRQAIYAMIRDQRVRDLLSPDEIVMTAANPSVRRAVRQADGSLTIHMVAGEPQVDDLKLRILEILDREGKSLVALNSLLYADSVNEAIVRRKLEIRDRSANEVIWKAAIAKATAVALNPITAVDLLGGAIVDVVMILSLSRLYGIPMTQQGAVQLLQKIALGVGGISASELLITFGLGSLKGIMGLAAPVTGGLSLGPYLPVAIAQASVAGVSSYSIGQISKVYLAHGATWGEAGPKAVIQDILASLDEQSILNRIKTELLEKLRA